MCIVKGDRVKICPLKLDDVYQMQNWGRHDNPLFVDYNFPQLNDKEIIEWFNIKTEKKSRKCFSVINQEEKVIGYLAMKNIRKFKKQATLGIVFDPNYINIGYGTEVIKIFLDYFFNKLNMKTMYLQVARYNKRAIKCYEKCGFEKVKQYKDRLEDQGIKIFEEDRFINIRNDFVVKKGVIYNYFFEMKIDRHRYNLCLSTYT